MHRTRTGDRGKKPALRTFQTPTAAFLAACLFLVGSPSHADLDRTSLPIQPPRYEPIRELDARNATPPPPFAVTAPEGAPNVVVILIDDIGFGATTPFGGPIETPTFDRLARGGLRFNHFHTTCLLYTSPSPRD